MPTYAERHTVTVTTDSSGDATSFTPVVTGRVITVIYTKTDFADTVDFTITAEGSSEGIWTESNVTASKTVAPRQATHDAVGAASLYAAAGLAVEDHIYLANDRVEIVVASGGSVKTGTFDVVIG